MTVSEASASGVRRALVAGAVVLVLGSLGVMCARVGERGRFASAYSTWSAGPAGTRGAFLLVERLGARPMRWAEDFGRLPPGAMLIALGGCEMLAPREVSRAEHRRLAEWVDAGGTLVVAGAHDYLPPAEAASTGTSDDLPAAPSVPTGGPSPAPRARRAVSARPAPTPSFGVHLVRDAEACVPRTGLLGALVRLARSAERDRGDGGPSAVHPDAGVRGPVEGVRGSETGPFTASHGETGDAVASDAPVARPDSLRQALDADPLPPARVALVVGGPLLGLGSIRLRDPATVVVDDPMAAEVVLRLPDERVAGVVVRRGRGRVVALASASAFQNRDLAASDGGVLLARLVRAYAPAGPVLFDEYHLGAGQARSTVGYLTDLGAGPLLLQLFLVTAFVVWRKGARFGAARPTPPPLPLGTASYVEGVAALYGKARDARALVSALARRALARVAAHHRLPQVDAALLAAALEERGRARQAAEVRRIADLAASADSATRLVERARAIDTVVAAATGADDAVNAARHQRGTR
jgi:hypothetical protein